MENDKGLKAANADPKISVCIADRRQTIRFHGSESAWKYLCMEVSEHGIGQDERNASPSGDLEAAIPVGSLPLLRIGEMKVKTAAQQTLSEVKIHPENPADESVRGTGPGGDRCDSAVHIEIAKASLVNMTGLLVKEKLSVGESRCSTDNTESMSEPLGLRRRRSSRVDSQTVNSHDGGRKTPEDEGTRGLISSHIKDSPISGESDMKQNISERHGGKHSKTKGIVGEDCSSLPGGKSVGKKGVELASLKDLQEVDSDRKVHESLDDFIRQTYGREPHMSFTNRPGDKPFQMIIENHQAAISKYPRNSLDMRSGQEDSSDLDNHQADVERDSSVTGSKGGGNLGRGSQGDRNLHGLKNSVPHPLTAFAAAAVKNTGKQLPGLGHLTDLPGWPLLSPSKVQLQKCDKCSREFCSPFNHRRHIRTHRRISHLDKEDLSTKRKNVAAYWDELAAEEAHQIVASSRNFDLEDLSGESVVSNLNAFIGQISSIPLPPAYMKAGQDLLDILDNKQGVSPLSSDQLLSILDEASEKTFLCGEQKYGDVSKTGLQEKNLVASLGFIVEQTLVKAWMANKDAEALRNQLELVKEEEAAQMKRERHVAKKKKKKEKSRQKGLKDRKLETSQLTLNEENESVDDENPSPEIIEEYNSPTASSASIGSSGHDNPLVEPLETEIRGQAQQLEVRDQVIILEDDHEMKAMEISSGQVLPKEHLSDTLDEDREQQSALDLVVNEEEGKQSSVVPPSSQAKIDEQGSDMLKSEQDPSILDSQKCTPVRPFKESSRVDFQESHNYQRGGWVSDPRFQEGPQQSSYRTLRRPTGVPYSPTSECGSSPVPGFYRGKPTGIRGTAPVQATQQWAKKTQAPMVVENIMDSQEDENLQAGDSSASVSNAKVIGMEHAVAAQELDADPVLSTSRTYKEEMRTSEKREPFLASVVSAAKVLAGTGGLGSMLAVPFSLNVNSEDWPPLSNSHATYYVKSTGSSVGANQCELVAKSLNRVNNDKFGHYPGLASSDVETSNTHIPSVIQTANVSPAGPGSGLSQKGIMVGSVSVPLGDYTSKPKVGSSGRRTYPLPPPQSYTAVLASPPVKPTRDVGPATASRHRFHEVASSLDTGEALTVQTVDPYLGPSHFRGPPSRPMPAMKLAPRHMRGPVYPAGDRGDRGVPMKQASWSSGPIRYPPQKVWRPVRLMNEAGGGTETECIPTSCDEQRTSECNGTKESASYLDEVRGSQVVGGESNFSREIPSSANETSEDMTNGTIVHDKNQRGGGDKNFETVNSDQSHNATTRDGKVTNNELEDSELEESHEEGDIATSISRNRAEKTNRCVGDNLKDTETNNVQEVDGERTSHQTITEPIPSNSAWIAEAVEFHSSRWNAAPLDPEAVTHKDDEERPELQTTRWEVFLETLSSIARQSPHKDSCGTNRELFGNDQTGEKSLRSRVVDEQSVESNNSEQDKSRVPQAAASEEGALQDTSPCEGVGRLNGEETGLSSTTGVTLVESQALERCDCDRQSGSRNGSSSSDICSGTSRQERWHRTPTDSTTKERPPDQPRQSHPIQKTDC